VDAITNSRYFRFQSTPGMIVCDSIVCLRRAGLPLAHCSRTKNVGNFGRGMATVNMGAIVSAKASTTTLAIRRLRRSIVCGNGFMPKWLRGPMPGTKCCGCQPSIHRRWRSFWPPATPWANHGPHHCCSAPLLLRNGVGDYNCLHQDLHGTLTFSFQAVVLISAPGSERIPPSQPTARRKPGGGGANNYCGGAFP